MAYHTPLDTCAIFSTSGASAMYPDSAIVNGGAGTTTNTASRLHLAREVAIFGYSVTTVGTTLQIYVGGGTPVAVVGLLFPTTALGTFIFPKPVLLKAAVAGDDCNISVIHAGASVATIYYQKLG